MFRSGTKPSLLLSLIVTISACAPPPRVEVVERKVTTVRAETERIGGSIIRIVQPRDTLHGIAFGSGLNVNQLAAWNDLSDTSQLRVGQQIRLTKPLNFKPRAKVKPVVAERRQVATVTQTLPSTTKVTPKISKKVSDRPTKAANTPIASRSVNWSWPVLGEVVERFSLSHGRQGIDILAKTGQAIFASGDGEVVYVGGGLKGYGNLIIIKHSEQYLSAYAHNKVTYVSEGQRVLARHKIGTIGLDKKGRQAMHFQIRKDGKPVSPLAYLPGR